MSGKNIKITIPATKDSFYTIYAQGVSQGAFLNPERKEYDVFLDAAYPIILFFTFKNYRRAFVCIDSARISTNIYKFSCVNKELSVISILRGRALDRFKRSLNYLCKHTANRCSTYDIRFYWQLAYLAKRALNSNQNLKLLAAQYDTERNLALEEIHK